MSADEEHIELLRSAGLVPASPEPPPELEAKLSALQRIIEAKEAAQRAAEARAAYEAGFDAAVEMVRTAAALCPPAGVASAALRGTARSIANSRDEMAERFERDFAPTTNQEGEQ